MDNSVQKDNKTDILLRKIIRIPSFLSGFLIFFSALILTYDIISRTMGQGTYWAGEVSVFFLTVMSFLGAGFALQSGKHVQVTFVLERLSPGINSMLAKVVKILMMLVALMLIYFGVNTVIESYVGNFRSPSMLALPHFLPQAAIPIGAVFLLIEVIRELLLDYSGSKRGKQ